MEQTIKSPAQAGPGTAEEQVRQLPEEWATATRNGAQADVLRNHETEVVIYDVVPPTKYEGSAAYRESWDDWQPTTEGDSHFDFDDLAITPGEGVAVAHGRIRCAGRAVSGREFEDWVRATFCLRRHGATGRVAHRHNSMPRTA